MVRSRTPSRYCKHHTSIWIPEPSLFSRGRSSRPDPAIEDVGLVSRLTSPCHLPRSNPWEEATRPDIQKKKLLSGCGEKVILSKHSGDPSFLLANIVQQEMLLVYLGTYRISSLATPPTSRLLSQQISGPPLDRSTRLAVRCFIVPTSWNPFSDAESYRFVSLRKALKSHLSPARVLDTSTILRYSN